jgi:hypothetical protein
MVDPSASSSPLCRRVRSKVVGAESEDQTRSKYEDLGRELMRIHEAKKRKLHRDFKDLLRGRELQVRKLRVIISDAVDHL